MTATTIRINERTFTLPESWNGLDVRQALECYNIIMSNSANLFQPQEIMPAKRIALVARLLKLDDKYMAWWRQDCIEAYGEEGGTIFFSELNAVLDTTNFLFEIEEGKDGARLYQIKLGLTRCPWPQLVYTSPFTDKKKTYHAPADGLENISLYELAQSFTIFEKWMQSKDDSLVDELIATLYRPSKPATPENIRSGYQGDRRLPLYQHEAMVKKRQVRMSTLPKEFKQLLMFWFASCRHHIVTSFPNIFQPPAELEIAGERVGNDYGWAGMLLALAGGIVHLDEISQQPWQNGFVYLSYLEDQRREQERQLKKSRS